MTASRLLLLPSLAALLTFSGCKTDAAAHNGASPQPAPAHTPVPAAPPVNPAEAGSISGVVHFKGTPPPRIAIDMSMDPACSLAGDNKTEQYIVTNGGLGNVYVYIKSGLPASSAPSGSPAVRIDQHGCRFVPHVAAVQQGGSVEFTNSDPTMHNVHTITLNGNPGLDVSQGPGAAPQVRSFPTAETMISIRCNNHPWMNGFLNVAPNPFFTVTKDDGTFSLSGLPPGTYTLAAIHEKLGEQDTQVTVPPHGTAKGEFNFSLR